MRLIIKNFNGIKEYEIRDVKQSGNVYEGFIYDNINLIEANGEIVDQFEFFDEFDLPLDIKELMINSSIHFINAPSNDNQIKNICNIVTKFKIITI